MTCFRKVRPSCLVDTNSTANEPGHSIFYKNACARSADSDQPAHPRSLIRVFTVRLKTLWILDYPQRALRRLWSDSADAQVDLSLRWAHRQFCGKCCVPAQTCPVQTYQHDPKSVRNKNVILNFLLNYHKWINTSCKQSKRKKRGRNKRRNWSKWKRKKKKKKKKKKERRTLQAYSHNILLR